MEISADSGVKIVLHQSLPEIYQTCISEHFQRTNDRMLMNVSAENSLHFKQHAPIYAWFSLSRF